MVGLSSSEAKAADQVAQYFYHRLYTVEPQEFIWLVCLVYVAGAEHDSVNIHALQLAGFGTEGNALGTVTGELLRDLDQLGIWVLLEGFGAWK